MMMWLVENWTVTVCGTAVVFVGVLAVWRFFRMPNKEQVSKVKEWLLWACMEAEKELGSGTGKIKLRQVYDLFLQRFPALAMAVSFDTFALWVDSALTEMRTVLADKKLGAVRAFILGGDGVGKN